MNRRNFIKNSGLGTLGVAAGGSLIQSCCSSKSSVKWGAHSKPSSLKVYWGDIHNHCNLTYGHGDMQSAFEAAKQQLDFVAVTPHAMWPDIPGKDDPNLQWVIDYHVGAFERLRAGKYDEYLAMAHSYDKPGEFLSFVSYECHSMEHGDHVVLNYDHYAPLVACTSVEELKAKLKGKEVFITPHHMGYQEGYRGYNWNAFSQGDQTPFVEIFSRHGLAESDQGDYNYLHDMGPRVYEGSALYGLEQGYKFGMMGSTDQHAGYPGSYGDGRIGVLSKSLTRKDIWQSLKNRCLYAATGDKIKIDFRINDAVMGELIKGDLRNIYLHVEAENYIDYVDIIKNGRSISRLNGPMETVIPSTDSVRAKLKIDFGWNRSEEPVKWDGTVEVTDGEILQSTPLFRGAAYTSPQQSKIGSNHDLHTTNVNKISNRDSKKVTLELYTTKNPNVLTPAMQGVLLDVNMPKNGKIKAKMNGQEFAYTLQELLEGTKAHFMNGWLSHAIQFNRAAPENAFLVEQVMQDNTPERDTDYYYIRVRQRDGQWSWSTPIWVERA